MPHRPENEPVSVTEWFLDLRNGNTEAANHLWNRYAPALIATARKHLKHSPQQAADEEDVLVSVFAALYNGAQNGQFATIQCREDLWWLLLSLTHRKSVSQIRRETADKRGGWKQTQSVYSRQSSEDSLTRSFDPVSKEPTPEFLLIFKEEYDRLLSTLRNDLLRSIAVMKLEGHTSLEIGKKLGISVRSVERKVSLIRQTWGSTLDGDETLIP
ncbi:MAG: hypothetical protein KF844_09275 [Cryobacterium sp.]|nr:hypothetical protein [Cryobacterium sp.]